MDNAVEDGPAEKDAEVDGEDVKAEQEEVAPKTKKRPRKSERADLEVFSGEALAVMDLTEIKGDVAALEGSHLYIKVSVLTY